MSTKNQWTSTRSREATINLTPVSTESEVFIEVTVTDLPSSPDFKQIELLSTVNTSHWISFSGECMGEYEHTQIVWLRRNIIYYGNIA